MDSAWLVVSNSPIKHMKLRTLFRLSFAFIASSLVHSADAADKLKVGYSDWPGYTVLEVAVQKGWFKEAGIDVEMVWFDYLPSLDAFSAGKIDGVTCVATDALVNGANGAKSKIVALLDYSDGSDAIVGKPGINSIKDLKGQKVGLELTLVEHSDVELVNTPTNETPQTLASGKVAAIGAWYPSSGQALKQVAGSKKLFSSSEVKGLIYDVLSVNPTSYAKNKEAWSKFVGVYYKCVDYVLDPKTKDDAIKIMAAKVGADVKDYAENIPGTHFLTLAEAKKAFVKGEGLDSIYGSMEVGNKFNLDNGVYKESQKPSSYLAPGIVNELK